MRRRAKSPPNHEPASSAAILSQVAALTRPVAAGRSVEGGVVDHHDLAVAADVDVGLDHLGAQLDRPDIRLGRVLGHLDGVAAVADDQRPGPVGARGWSRLTLGEKVTVPSPGPRPARSCRGRPSRAPPA